MAPRLEDDENGLKVLAQPTSLDGFKVDIVFVHGLTGKQISTWRAKQEGKSWPETLLAKNIPEARILAFGYDADISGFVQVAGLNRVANHASNLLGRLANLRDSDESNDRPIIFVAHSLGGLIVEDALTQSFKAPDEHIEKILKSTKGIIFLGTPHCGSGLADLGEVLTRFIKIFRPANSSLINVLKPSSETLAKIQTGFFSMIRARQGKKEPELQIVCFHEELPMTTMGKSYVVVEKHSAILSQYASYSIYADHSGMTKFSKADDDGYLSILGEIRRWIKELRDSHAKSASAKVRDHWASATQGGVVQNGNVTFSGNNNVKDGSVLQGTFGNINM